MFKHVLVISSHSESPPMQDNFSRLQTIKATVKG